MLVANGAPIHSIGQTSFSIAPNGPPMNALVFDDRDLSRSLVSVADLCNEGLEAHFSKERLDISDGQNTLLSIAKGPKDKFWNLPISCPEAPPMTGFSGSCDDSEQEECLGVIHNSLDAEFVSWWHAVLGSPPVSSLIKALEAGYLSGIPRLTAKIVRDNPPVVLATGLGHLDAKRQGQDSTHKPSKRLLKKWQPPKQDSEWHHELIVSPSENERITDTLYTDCTGAFPYMSFEHSQYVLVSVYRNYIYCVAMASRSAAEYLRAFGMIYNHLAALNVFPTKHVMDNETSSEIEAFLKSKRVQVQYVPPGQHRANRAERAIRIVKDLLVSMLCTAAPSCPIQLWDKSLEQLNVIVNLYRPYGPNPKVSAWLGLMGKPYDFRAHPLAPFGSRLLFHVPASSRKGWAPHGKVGIYLSPAWKHYRAYKIWHVETANTVVSDSIYWDTAPLVLPGASPIELLLAAIKDLGASTTAIFHGTAMDDLQKSKFRLAVHSAAEALKDVAVLAAPDHPQPTLDLEVLNWHSPAAVPAHTGPAPAADSYSALNKLNPVPPKSKRHPAATDVRRIQPEPVETTQAQAQAQPEVPAEPEPVLPDNQAILTGAPQNRVLDTPRSPPKSAKKSQKRQAEAGPEPTIVVQREEPTPPALAPEVLRGEATIAPPPAALPDTADEGPWTQAKTGRRGRNRGVTTPVAVAPPDPGPLEPAPGTQETQPPDLRGLTPAEAEAQGLRKSHRIYNRFVQQNSKQPDFVGNLEDNLRDAAKISWHKAKSGPEAAQWAKAGEEEFDRLVSSKTIAFISQRDMPEGKRAAHLNHVLKRKRDDKGEITYRVRATIRGDQVKFDGDKSAWTAELPAVKIFLSAIVSEDAKAATADISDFYLNSRLPASEYMRVHRSQIPDAVVSKYGLEKLFHNDYVYCRVGQTIYGLPQAGKLAQDRLVAHLASKGFNLAPHTPCLFLHNTRKISFLLYVDDFLIKYHRDEDLDFLFATLRELYSIKTDREAKKFIGISLKFDRTQRSVTLSIPGYVKSLVEKFGIKPEKRVDSPMLPAIWTNRAEQQLVVEDDSPPLNDSEKKRLQKIVGACLWYAMCVDYTMLAAVNKIAINLGAPTLKHMEQAEHMLAYAHFHPNAALVLRASDMSLHVHSDASFHSESEGRSRLAGFFFLGTPQNPPVTPYGGIKAVSTASKIVLYSSHDAEYAAMFQNALDAIELRNTLHDLGYPQSTTTIVADNQKAVEAVNGLVKAKKSKTVKLRYHAVLELVRDGIIKVDWRPGNENLADLFTKALSGKHHRLMRHLYVKDEALISC